MKKNKILAFIFFTNFTSAFSVNEDTADVVDALLEKCCDFSEKNRGIQIARALDVVLNKNKSKTWKHSDYENILEIMGVNLSGLNFTNLLNGYIFENASFLNYLFTKIAPEHSKQQATENTKKNKTVAVFKKKNIKQLQGYAQEHNMSCLLASIKNGISFIVDSGALTNTREEDFLNKKIDLQCQAPELADIDWKALTKKFEFEECYKQDNLMNVFERKNDLMIVINSPFSGISFEEVISIFIPEEEVIEKIKSSKKVCIVFPKTAAEGSGAVSASGCHASHWLAACYDKASGGKMLLKNTTSLENLNRGLGNETDNPQVCELIKYFVNA